MKTFKMSPLNTEEGSSPPPPPAPADPSIEAANAAVAAAAAAAAAAEGVATQYSDMYPTYNTYLMTRYSDQRYHTPTTYTYGAGGSHISAHTSASDSYYRYPDYSSRYPYSSANSSTCTTTGGGGSGTSPRWRRRSYDPDYITNRRPGGGQPVISGGGSSNSRPLSDMASTIVNPSSSSSVLMRSRSRSRVGSSDYDTTSGGSGSNYLRYVSPSASSYPTTTRPISGYIYGHSYVPSASALDSSVSAGGGPRLGSAPPASTQPQPPPNYNAMDREVSARIRRYQADPSS